MKRRYWVVSPNVSNNPAEEPVWKKVIFEKKIAFMGYYENHDLGYKFSHDIQKGDIILIAQGGNQNKRLFIGGIVTTDAIWEIYDNSPREAYNRVLSPCLSKKELESIDLNFTDSAFGAAERIPSLYELHPYRNDVDKKIVDRIELALKIKTQQQKMQEKIDLLEYKKQIILQGPPGTGKTKTAKDIAVEMLGLGNVKDLNNNERFKLIQFHPSYTYEDFVRGIVSVPNEDGEGVLFKTENKILAEFAEKALKNKLDSQKGASLLSKEKWLNEQFDKFIDFISEEIDQNRKVELTESVFIIALDNDAFRYKGTQGWTEKGTRMLFKDIKQAFLDNNTIRQELKHNQNVSRSAYWDATYFIKTVDLFRKFLIDEQITFVVDTTENEPLKNYVLIIDEINRANLPSVLGELIYALEYRDEAVESMYEFEGKREIILPSNLYIIGTMNTADRSVGHIDYAIKRRFAFVDVLPTDQAIDDVVTDPDLNAKAKDLYHKVAELFNEDKSKSVYLQSDFKAKDVQLGHSYFLIETEKQLELKLEFEIRPLLNEYVKDGILSEDALIEIAKL